MSHLEGDNKKVGHVKNVRSSSFWAKIYRLTLNQGISCQFLVFEPEIVFRNFKWVLNLFLLKFTLNKSMKKKKISSEYTSETSALLVSACIPFEKSQISSDNQ